MKVLLSLLTMLIPSVALCQDLPARISKADSLVQAFYEKEELPGLSLSIYKDDGLILSKGYGFADISEEKPVDPSLTKFRIGSVSKTLTAAGMGVLMEDEKLDPDRLVQAYVPAFPEKKYPITVRQVAGHIAGIRHYRGDEFMSKKLYSTVDEGLTIFADDSLLFEPGSRYSYSSYGWNLISAVIEGASGEEFLPFMRNNVFDPLGMNNTVAEWSNKDIPHVSTYYERQNDKNVVADFVDNSYKWAGGGFVGTTEDLIRFGTAFFDEDFLSYPVQYELMAPQKTSDGESTDYGMGWSTMVDFAGRTWYGHGGGSVGGSTMFLINKEERMVIAFVSNRSGVNYDNLHFKLAEIFLDE